MRPAVIVSVLLFASAARADVVPLAIGTPAPAKLGSRTITATVCTVDGPALVFPDDLMPAGQLATAPGGDVIVLDAANRLRRYHPKKGKGCALAIDRTLGKDGVLDLGLAADRRPYLAVDGDGTIYVSDVPRQPLRVSGGKVEPMCGDHTRVNASARSPIVWRYEFASEATRERGDCSGAKGGYLDGWEMAAEHLWVIDDRAVGYGEISHHTYAYNCDHDGALAGTLDDPKLDFVTVERITRCGGSICALEKSGTLVFWDDHGGLTGTIPLEPLIGAKYVRALDADGAAGSTYVLVHANDLGKGPFAGAIVRVDGLAP